MWNFVKWTLIKYLRIILKDIIHKIYGDLSLTSHVWHVIPNNHIKIYYQKSYKIETSSRFDISYLSNSTPQQSRKIICGIRWTFAQQKMKRSSCLLINIVFCLLTQNLIGKYLLVQLEEGSGEGEGKMTLIKELKCWS